MEGDQPKGDKPGLFHQLPDRPVGLRHGLLHERDPVCPFDLLERHQIILIAKVPVGGLVQLCEQRRVLGLCGQVRQQFRVEERRARLVDDLHIRLLSKVHRGQAPAHALDEDAGPNVAGEYPIGPAHRRNDARGEPLVRDAQMYRRDEIAVPRAGLRQPNVGENMASRAILGSRPGSSRSAGPRRR